MPPQYNPDVYEPAEGCRKVKQEQREKKLVEYTKWAIKHCGDASVPTPLSIGDYVECIQREDTSVVLPSHPSPVAMSDVLWGHFVSPHPSPVAMSDVLYLFYDGYTKGEWERLI